MTTANATSTPRVVTEPIEGCTVIGLDPRTTEISSVAYSVEGVRKGAARAVGSVLRHLASAVWSPDVRISLVSEVRVDSGGEPKTSTLAIGVCGHGGDSGPNVAAIATEFERRLDDLVVLRRADPRFALSRFEATHCVRIRQATRVIGGPGGIEVPAIWHGYPTPLAHLTSMTGAFGTEMRVRVTYLSTSPTADEWRSLREAAERLVESAGPRDRSQADLTGGIDRALASYRHLSNLLDGPIWAGEVAVASADPLAWAQRQLLAGAMTSAPDVHWDDTGPRVLDAGPVRGGFEIEDLRTEDVVVAHRLGLPVHGGFRPRSLNDLFSVVGLMWDVAPPPVGTEDRLRDLQLVPPAEWRAGRW